MKKELPAKPQTEIQNQIFTIRGLQIMLDSHLAEMYGVETKVLNQSVKRNIERFPNNFRFQLTEAEFNLCSRSQIVTLNTKKELPKRGQNIKYPHYGFTEQGVAMLSAILRSKTAIHVSIQIINAFVEMRKIVFENAGLFQRLDKMEIKQIESDQKFEQIFKALESKNELKEKGIFFEGQIFDAYNFVSEIIKKAEKSILLIDNYIDETVLTLLCKRKMNVTATIFTKKISQQLALDLSKHNEQYPIIEIKNFSDSHDRFLIIDDTQLFHIGASLKDLGKKWFGFSRMDSMKNEVLQKLNTEKI